YAKAFQQQKGFELTDVGMQDLHPRIAEELISVRKSGPKSSDFNKTIDNLRKSGDIEYNQVFKAWKLYKIAVGDFFIDEAQTAKDKADELRNVGEYAGAVESRGQFTRRLSQMQNYVQRNVGKPTDIYTEDRRYVYPGLAEAAGVYLKPEQIMERVTSPLGEDLKLHDIYKDLTKDLGSGKEMMAPAEKARTAIRGLSNMNEDVVALITNAERLASSGDKIKEVWQFDKIIDDISRLRAALERHKKFNIDEEFQAPQVKNLELTIKYLKNIENAYTPIGKNRATDEWGKMGLEPVPKFEDPSIQKALHMKNIERVQKYFSKTLSEGGPAKGERFTYNVKIFDELGNTLKNVAYDFKKLGEALDNTGKKYGSFSQNTRDIQEVIQGANKTFGAAIMRAVRWGAASTIVYGGVRKMGDAIDTMADMETAMAELRMVMNSVGTDFNKMQSSAIGMAKEYGVPVKEITKGMRIFAQQGLSQAQVLDRTKTATLASNISTLSAFEATEALTAATKIYGDEGQSTLKFLDAWSEVEARHAITAEDLAAAIKKSATAAKQAGVDFDELNGIVAAIGSTTRQSGKEVGTSLRFIFRRLSSEKGPQALAKLGIPVMSETGDLRKGYDVLTDLSNVWGDLSNAQKLNISQAVGGTRQYNQFLVMMENWDEVVQATAHSMNSKGSSERRNLEIMKTYTKQLEQTKQAAAELQIQFGEAVLPVAKAGLKGIRSFLEVVSAIPGPVKAIAGGFALLIGYITKGDSLIQGFIDRFRTGKTIFGGFGQALTKSLEIGMYEMFGKGDKDDPMIQSLKTIGKEGPHSLRDFHSALGKTAFLVSEVGKNYNEFIGKTVKGSGGIIESTGKKISWVGDKIGDIIGISGVVQSFKSPEDLMSFAKGKGLGYEEVLKILKTQGVKGVAKIGGAALMVGGEIAGQAAEVSGDAIAYIGEKVGGAGEKFIKSFAAENTGLVKSIAPLAATTVALIPAFKAMNDYYGKITSSAQDYEKSVHDGVVNTQEELSNIKSMDAGYGRLQSQVDKINKVRQPSVKAEQQRLEKYKSPLLMLVDVQSQATDLANQLAESNVNLVVGYDQLGNAILKTSKSLKEYMDIAAKTKTQKLIDTDLEVLDKYVSSLSDIDGPENWKVGIKQFIKEIPLVGEKISDTIKVSPAKSLEMATNEINKLIAAKNKAPLTTAFDKDIIDQQDALKKFRAGYDQTYKDFKRVFSDISFEGLDPDEIVSVLKDPILMKGYEIMVDVEPRFNISEMKGKIKPEDILGAEVMKRVFPEIGGFIDVNKELTKAKIESSGIMAREGEVRSGDLVTFMEEAAKDFNMAGNQAKIELKKGIDGTYEWVASYFNNKTLQIEEKPFTSEMQKMVDQIFPVYRIREDLEERIDSLNEFVMGASAGLIGLDATKFK
ncbi:MAG: phage tail tape measure protein, partial [Candidatus Bathyarchaeota archaeon]|nr:phage tail tape measure protein [Candidatus Bathyarchaeota archaeon]